MTNLQAHYNTIEKLCQQPIYKNFNLSLLNKKKCKLYKDFRFTRFTGASFVKNQIEKRIIALKFASLVSHISWDGIRCIRVRDFLSPIIILHKESKVWSIQASRRIKTHGSPSFRVSHGLVFKINLILNSILYNNNFQQDNFKNIYGLMQQDLVLGLQTEIGFC